MMAVRIMALSNKDLAEKLEAYRKDMADGVISKDKSIADKL